MRQTTNRYGGKTTKRIVFSSEGMGEGESCYSLAVGGATGPNTCDTDGTITPVAEVGVGSSNVELRAVATSRCYTQHKRNEHETNDTTRSGLNPE